MGKGDTLASGGVRASYGYADIPADKWEQAFGKPGAGRKKKKRDAGRAEFWVSDPEEREAVAFLESRDYVVHKRHAGRAVVPDDSK